jgi:hypothetical protein
MALSFIKPQIQEAFNQLIFEWPDLELKVIADRISEAGTAELWFYHKNKQNQSLLHTAKVNLLSSPTMGQLTKRMTTYSSDVPWPEVMTFITANTVEYQRRGEPPIIIEPSTELPSHPGYYIEPIVMKNVPSVIFGEKGVSKTTLGLICLGLIATGAQSDFGLTANEKANIALLDWESNEELTRYVLSKLVYGGVIPRFSLPYLRCKQTLADDINRIANFLTDHQARVVLLDSLGQAAGSDKYDSAGKASALKFFECLRQLNVTSLIIAQTAKGEEAKRTIYGSTFFTYYSRNIFELRAVEDEMDESILHLALIHQESNYSKRYAPLGCTIHYTESTIEVQPEQVSISQFVEAVSQTKALLDLLNTGPKHRQEMKEYLDISAGQIGVLLTRLKKRGLVIDEGNGVWKLVGR